MAKPRQGLPGNSGHIHISLVDEKTGENLFGRESADPDARWPDEQHLTKLGRHFLAGILSGMQDVMPMLAPTVNSYKRLVENYWAPVTASWGFEHRSAAVRVICPPSTSAGAARLEVRVPGADANPHFALAALLALGWRGVEKELDLPMPPLAKDEGTAGGVRLARSLREATVAFMKPASIARECFGDEFVDHYGGTREHECQLFDEAVTSWQVERRSMAQLLTLTGRSIGILKLFSQCSLFNVDSRDFVRACYARLKTPPGVVTLVPRQQPRNHDFALSSSPRSPHLTTCLHLAT